MQSELNTIFLYKSVSSAAPTNNSGAGVSRSYTLCFGVAEKADFSILEGIGIPEDARVGPSVGRLLSGRMNKS